jgi:hypothetical protein
MIGSRQVRGYAGAWLTRAGGVGDWRWLTTVCAVDDGAAVKNDGSAD